MPTKFQIMLNDRPKDQQVCNVGYRGEVCYLRLLYCQLPLALHDSSLSMNTHLVSLWCFCDFDVAIL